MEAGGKVNAYVCEACNFSKWTVNLNTGTTPFLTSCPKCGQMAQSCFYRLGFAPGKRVISVTPAWAWYRPTREELWAMGNAETMRHVLGGGLLCQPLTEARPLRPDPTSEAWDFDKWAAFAETTYGVRPNPENPFYAVPNKDPAGPGLTLRDLQARHAVGVQVGTHGRRLWVCVDGVAVLRVKAPVIHLEDMRDNHERETGGHKP
jgi:hypothetical protein